MDKKHTQIDKTFTKDTHSKPNDQFFPKQMVIQLPYLKTAVTPNFTYFLFSITKQNKIGSILGICYSGDHIAEDNIHTNNM